MPKLERGECHEQKKNATNFAALWSPNHRRCAIKIPVILNNRKLLGVLSGLADLALLKIFGKELLKTFFTEESWGSKVTPDRRIRKMDHGF